MRVRARGRGRERETEKQAQLFFFCGCLFPFFFVGGISKTLNKKKREKKVAFDDSSKVFISEIKSPPRTRESLKNTQHAVFSFREKKRRRRRRRKLVRVCVCVCVCAIDFENMSTSF